MEFSSEPGYLYEILGAVLQFSMAAALYTAPINLVLLVMSVLRRRSPQTRRGKRITGWVTFGYVTASIVLTPVGLAMLLLDTYADLRFVLASTLPAMFGAFTWFVAYRRPVAAEAQSQLFPRLTITN